MSFNSESGPLLGVLGGMGPLATALFLEDIANFTAVKKDQDHLDIIIYSMPSIPDRTGYILGKTTTSPLPDLKKYILELKDRAVDLVAVPCVTAMYFHDKISELGVEVADISKIAAKRVENFTNVGIMATTATTSARLFETNSQINYILPQEKYQNMIMDTIYTAIKTGSGFEHENFSQITAHLKEEGADVVILGCTELSVVKRQMQLNEDFFVDSLSELAKYCIRSLGKRVKGE
ncbi:MAG: amino acid racemase [Defluviitaleaceae bacterium]|nr:amino acid racemase [Defluviitaleaceae bacterium]